MPVAKSEQVLPTPRDDNKKVPLKPKVSTLRPEQLLFKARMLTSFTDSFFKIAARELPIDLIMSPGWVPDGAPQPFLRQNEFGLVLSADGAFWVWVPAYDDRGRPILEFVQSGGKPNPFLKD